MSWQGGSGRSAAVKLWQERVRQAASAVWPSTEGLVDQRVTIRIGYFYIESAPDLDNILKPIIDALKGVILSDDELVDDIVASKRLKEGNFTARNVSPVLAGALAGNSDFVHVVVAQSGEVEVLK
jgi:Holliday junction resolvase RusA-like endonuclease